MIKILIVLFLAGYFFDRWEFLRELPRSAPACRGLARLAAPAEAGVRAAAAPRHRAWCSSSSSCSATWGRPWSSSFLFLILYCVARGRPVMLAPWDALVIGRRLLRRLPARRTRARSPAASSMWLSPWDNSFRGGDHLAQSLWALAGGALTGTGLGLGQPRPGARGPHRHGARRRSARSWASSACWRCFGLYAAAGLARACRRPRRAGGVYGFFLALGLTLLIALQILLIARRRASGCCRSPGVVSPFLSFGRSAMLANFLILGHRSPAISARPGDAAAAAARFRGARRWARRSASRCVAGAIVLARRPGSRSSRPTTSSPAAP